MAHRFRAAEALVARLEAAAVPSWDRAPYKIVEKNAGLMEAGRVELGEGNEEQLLPPAPPTEAIQCPPEGPAAGELRFPETEVCVADVDTLTAALVLSEACALNFANAQTPGGGYVYGAMAQEEDLCRLLPQLHPALLSAQRGGHYPIRPEVALLSRHLLAVRRPGTYELCRSLGECCVVTSAMPNRTHWPGSVEWNETVALRVRSVLNAAKVSGLPNLVLGAWGCGAFGNPPDAVAAIFAAQLSSPEFRGAFARVVFAIIDPRDEGNLKPFETVVKQLVGM